MRTYHTIGGPAALWLCPAVSHPAGDLLWRMDIGAPVFTPLILLPAAPAAAGPGNSNGPAAAESATVQDVVVVADQAGRLSGLSLASGAVLWSHAIPTSGNGGAVPLRAAVMLEPAPLAGTGATPQVSSKIAWAAGPGTVGVMLANGPSCQIAAAQLPAEAFSMPAGFGRRLVCGCRDDYLYCLEFGNDD